MRELLVVLSLEAAVDLPLQSLRALNPKEEAAQAVNKVGDLVARRVVLRPQPVERPERFFDEPHLLPRMAAALSAPEPREPRPMWRSPHVSCLQNYFIVCIYRDH